MANSFLYQLTLTSLCAALFAYAPVFETSFVNGEERSSQARPGEEAAVTGSSNPMKQATPNDEAGHCVLLRNGNVLFGVARQLGEFVVIHTERGGEIRLERQEVLCWANSLRDLYRYRIDHRQSGNLSAMLRDAEWCLRFELFDLASQDIRKVLSIDPRNAQAARLENRVRREFAKANSMTETSDARRQIWGAKEADPRMSARGGPSLNDRALNDRESQADDRSRETTSTNHFLRVVGYQNDLGNDHVLETPDDIDPRTLRRFAGQIQPMLVNRCGRCHDASVDDLRGWKLVTPAVGSRASSRMTRDNLWSTLSYIDSKSPEQSLLFTKATTAHGGEEAPLGVRSVKATETLRSWLWMASAWMVQHAAKNSSPVVTADQILESPESRPIKTPISPTSQVVHHPEDIDDAVQMEADHPIGPSRLPLVTNPFDPDLFNRRLDLNSSDTRE